MDWLADENIITVRVVVIAGAFSLASALLTVTLGAVITVFSVKLESEKTKRLALEHQALEQRRNLYLEYLYLWIDMFRDMKKGITKVQSKNGRKIQDIEHKMMFFGSDEVVRQFNINLKKSEGLDEKTKVLYQGKLFKAMRKDLGYPETDLKETEILQLILREDVDRIFG